MTEPLKFPYDQNQIYAQGIVFFAKMNIYHYQDVTEPNLFPHAYGMYVSKDKLDFERAENKKLREALTKENILEVITQWKIFWMNQTQNSEADRKNYLNRAMGVDANMKHNLAERLVKAFTSGGE